MSSLLNKITGAKPAKVSSPKIVQKASSGSRARHMQIMATSYTSKPVKVPDTFLRTTPWDAKPILTYPINFEETPLPEYEGLYAVVLDNVLSESECKQLIQYAQMSAGASEEGVENDGWKPALVNVGPGKEAMIPEYRNSDRIIWDDQEIMNRLWQRCLTGEGIREKLSRIEKWPQMQGMSAADRGDKWHVTRLNERMRFLRYGPGQYFKEHCDGSYQVPGTHERSFVTLHLYLNDSEQALIPKESTDPNTMAFPPPIPDSEPSTTEGEPLRGGATPFHSTDMKRRVDVDPKMGRVLLFQHKSLLHSGDDVTSGVKYTMRTDLMYELELAE